ncbi:unnamed protein product [Fraxinus pennsylvanica]|uniref:Uncharacterized protein n=1 Tax=Fraxinus pennsylvanica TaxID=56036 RepID=A0AAD1ZX98_9LAMI|nr:unnamed protein product [Fraxinus pennsylvanica]
MQRRLSGRWQGWGIGAGCCGGNGFLRRWSEDWEGRFERVQEKKVKKISEMNVELSKFVGNGSIASSIPTEGAPYIGISKEEGCEGGALTIPLVGGLDNQLTWVLESARQF